MANFTNPSPAVRNTGAAAVPYLLPLVRLVAAVNERKIHFRLAKLPLQVMATVLTFAEAYSMLFSAVVCYNWKTFPRKRHLSFAARQALNLLLVPRNPTPITGRGHTSNPRQSSALPCAPDEMRSGTLPGGPFSNTFETPGR